MTVPLLLLLLLLVLTCPAAGELVRIDERERRDIEGYESIAGTAHFAVDRKLAANRGIDGLDRAPRNAAGRVEFSADVRILRPKRGGNGTLLFEVSNRGGQGMIGLFNHARRASGFGDQFLLARGYTLVWLGWQHDLAPDGEALRAYLPRARGVTGRVRAEYVPPRPETRMPLADPRHLPYAVTDPQGITVTVRDAMTGPRSPVSGWRLEGQHLVFGKPLEPGRIYEAVYPSRDPEVAMLGLAGIRDLLSALREREKARTVLGFGSSQSSMLLRAFLYHGFNQDERGARVFDGILGHIAGGRRSDLGRFAQASRTAAPLRGMLYGTDTYPFTDAPLRDPVTGATDGVLAHLQPRHVPRILYTNSAYEYWGSSASLLHTTLDGKADVEPPPSTRIYMFAGGQHGPAPFPPRQSGTQHLQSPNDYTWSLRALLLALDAWVTDGKEPPASRYPRIADGTLVAESALRRVEGIRFPGQAHVAYRHSRDVPPKVGQPFVSLIPQVDADGNDLAGIRMPEVDVPLAVYTGWNLRAAAAGQPDELASGAGSFLPFAPQRILERYGTLESYLERFEQSARKLAADGFLLPQDIVALKEEARRRWSWGLQQTAVSQRR